MKVSVRGGAPVLVTEVDRNIRGASWGSDGNIYFNPGTRSALSRVAADGGEPETLASPSTERREKSYRFVDVLPAAKALLLTVDPHDIESFDDASIAALSLETGEMRILMRGGSGARYSSTGHLVYARGGALFAVPFDANALAVTGVPIRVLDGVGTWPTMGTAEFSLSRDGSLVYAPGVPMGIDHRVVWVDRTGAATALLAETDAFYQVRMSLDRSALAVSTDGANMSLWIYDLDRQVLSRLVSGFNNWVPVWTPDGQSLTFNSDRDGPLNIFLTAADGNGEARRLTRGEGQRLPRSWTPDGQTLLFSDISPETGEDIWLLTADGEMEPFLQTSANENQAEFSPNGLWVAYESDESGRMEIYVCGFPDPGAKRRVSMEGGTDPVWSPTRRELFFRNGDRMIGVVVETEGTLVLAQPRLLFESKAYQTHAGSYDVSADGERFIMIDRSESARPATELVVVQNWAEELKRLVPTQN